MFVKTALAQTESASNLIKTIVSSDIFGGLTISDIFVWSFGVGGIVAIGVITFGGIMYIASAGNVSRQEDAKEWIKAAIYGLILLGLSYLILKTINPSILNLSQ